MSTDPASNDRYDLVLRGGEVLDPVTGRRGHLDVGIMAGRIARVGRDIPSGVAREEVDARGCVVLPGLIDLHTHIFAGGGYWSVDPRPVAWRTGVTTWVDAGSAGAYNAGAFRRTCQDFGPLRVKAFLNISAAGLVAETGEGRSSEMCDPGLCAAILQANPDLFIGVKCRLDRFAAGPRGIGPLLQALVAAETSNVPVMVHVGAAPPSIDQVLDLLRPGDLVTHCTTGQSMSLIGADGRPRPSALRARQRGVLFDVGHGSGGFSFDVAEALLAHDLGPDIISSDLHQRSIVGPAFDLPTCMSKFLGLGMSLLDVVRATTTTPALVVGAGPVDGGPAAGAIAPGQPADLSVFELLEGDFVLYDSYVRGRRTETLLVNRATIADGVLLRAVPPAPPPPWAKLTGRQLSLARAQVTTEGPGLGTEAGSRAKSGAEDLRRPWALALDRPGDFVAMAIEGPPGPLDGGHLAH